MPNGVGRGFNRLISGLLLLGLLAMSIVQAQATVPPGIHGGIAATAAVAHDVAMAGDLWRSAHEHGGAPCDGHDGTNGPACCLTGACPMLSGWLPVSPTVLPAIAPMMLVYPDAPPVRADGVRSAPTLPPPRHIA